MRPWQAVEVNVIKSAEEEKCWQGGGMQMCSVVPYVCLGSGLGQAGTGKVRTGHGGGEECIGGWWTEHGYRVREGDDTR